MKIWYKIETDIDLDNLPYPFDNLSKDDFQDWFDNANEVEDLIKCCNYSIDIGHD